MRIIMLLITIVISISLAHAATCPDLDRLQRPDEDLVPKLGFGADRDREVIKQISCLNYSENFLDGGEAKINSSVLSNYKDVYEKLKLTAGGSASYSVFKASANATYEKIFHSRQFEKSFVLDYDIKLGTADATLDSNNPLNQTGQRVSNDACSFKRYCGNNYVCQTDKGANISVKLDFQFSSVYEKNEFTAEASAGIKDLKICCKSFSASLNASIERLSETTRKNSSVRIEAIQRGGYVEDLGSILGGGYVFTCSLDNLGDCSAALDTIAQYVSSEDFAAGVRDLPSVSAYKNCPYEAIPGVPNLPQEATAAVQTARTNLGDKYLELLADRDTLEQTLSLSLSAERRQQLENLLTILETDAEAVRQVGESCLNDLSNCPQNAAQVFAGLRAYDRVAVQPNSADGLVAYYPFNGNALDESGYGNDGVVYGASLAKDRFGTQNASFSFNGTTSYIEINNSSELSGFSDMSISVWVKKDRFNSRLEGIVTKWFQDAPLSYQSINQDTYAISFLKDNTLMGFTGQYHHYDGPHAKDLISLDSWAHVTFTHSAVTGGKIYVNGKLEGKNAINGAIVPSLNSIYIGADNNKGQIWRFYDGKIDDVHIHNRALTATEIQQLYQTTETQLNQPPLAMFTTSAIQGVAPFTVNLDASASSDADGNISRYDWQSSDGQSASGINAVLTFANAGEYSITLTITDNQGATSQAMKTITVTDDKNGGQTIGGCTNAHITDCRARYEFINNQGSVCAPCVVVPGAFGVPQIFALEMRQTNPLNLAFELDPLTLKAHDTQDACAASFAPLTGVLNLPCVTVDTDSFNVDMQLRPNSLIFDVTGAQ